ncbi:MAG TPA: GAF domain-containing protein, partial [Roseiarcus sp.]|nr:GAF domain-containing protein [Roseiarcus sp.]
MGALIPIMHGGSSIGVFAFCPDRSRPFSDPVVELLKHVVAKVSSALDHFDRERERGRLSEANDLLDRRFRLLNATNKAILRARSVGEMFRMVCEAATGPGRLLGASVSLHDPNSPWFARAACSGALGDIYETVRISADPTLREGQGVAANVFRTGEPCFIDDLANDPRAAPWRSRLLAGGVRAGAVLPLMKSGQVVGVCSFFLGNDSGPLDDARIQLTTRVAETISFGMELFERQEQKDNVTRMFIALSATNEAIMRAQTRAELFELVCDAAVKGGNFTATLVGLPQEGSDFLRIVAAAGPTATTSKNAALAISAEQPEGRGLCGEAFRTGRPCISNDYLNEIRESVLLTRVRREGTRSGAALPLLRAGKPVGVLLFMSCEPGAFTIELVELLQRLADNVSFALENFDRADERRLADEQKERLTRMFAALSATNEAIMRALTRAELFRLVCEAAVQGGRFTSTIIALVEPGSDFLRIAATAGPNAELSKTLRLATTPAYPEGRGLTGTAFRTRQPCISNDYLADQRAVAFREKARERGSRSCAALPLLNHGEAVGVLLFLSSEVGAFTSELVELLQRLAENVSFALENFDRADDRRLAEEQKERLTRMYAALSATNEAIMRASTRAELFELVCKAAANGSKFAATTIALAEPGSDFLRAVATAGPATGRPRTVTLAITPAHPAGRGVTGTAFRTRQPCISNDYLADERSAAFRGEARARGVKSCAALPLLNHGEAIGVMLFISSEQGAFTPELVELLQRLGENLSFALENFDRADGRRLADEQKERLSRMFAALSATNEAIMRAST